MLPNRPLALRLLPPGTLSPWRRRIDPWMERSINCMAIGVIHHKPCVPRNDRWNQCPLKISRPSQEPIKERTTPEICVTFAETVALIVLVFSRPGVWYPLISRAIFSVPLFPRAIEILSSLSQMLYLISHYSSVLRVSVMAFWIPNVSLFTLHQSSF